MSGDATGDPGPPAPGGPGRGAGGRGPGGRASGGRAPEVVVALDVPDADRAFALADRLPTGTWVKVGLELFTAAGPGVVRRLDERGHPVFLDLKLHDIPNTVAGGVRAASRLGVRLLTLHAAGGPEMLAAAVAAAAEGRERVAEETGESTEAGGDGEAGAAGAASQAFDGGLTLLAVTVLTSLDDAALRRVTGSRAGVEEAVLRLAGMAREAGVGGLVASVAECRRIREELGRDVAVATPGIRLPGDATHDQARVATPGEAAEAGADYLVVGRSVRSAEDPAAALERVRAHAAGADR